MSFNPLKRMLLTPRSPHAPETTHSPSPPPSSDDHAPAIEDPSIEEVEALLAEGLGSANGQPADDDAAFLDLIDEIVGDPNGTDVSNAACASEQGKFISLEDPEVAHILHAQECMSPRLGASVRKSAAHTNADVSGSFIPSKGLVSRSLVAAAAKGGKPRDKSRSVREGAEKLVSLMRSGKMSAGRVRSAISRSSQRRVQVSERSKRVNDSFLSFDTAYDGQDSINGSHATPTTALNQPEVMRKAPLTAAQRVRRLEQNVIAAKQEWESKYRVLMMVESGVQTHTGSENLDSRYVQHKAAVDAAAQKVLEAAGELLLVQVEQGMARLPGNQIYYYYDDRTRLQGPYKAVQLCKLAKLKVMPQECMVLIDLAQIGGVSVRAPSEDLIGLLADPAKMSQAANQTAPSAFDTRQGTNSSMGAGSAGVDAHVSDPRTSNVIRCTNSSTSVRSASDTRSSREDERLQNFTGDMQFCEQNVLRSDGERWRDSGARPRKTPPEVQKNLRETGNGKDSALLLFEEEKALEVYTFEDSTGEICGPFSFNELQVKYARGTVTDPLLLMYDTDYGTTVLSVSQLFRNMAQRHDEILAANNSSPPLIETLTSCGQVAQRLDTSETPSNPRHVPVSNKAQPKPLISILDRLTSYIKAALVDEASLSSEQGHTAAVPPGDEANGNLENWATGAAFAAAAVPNDDTQVKKQEMGTGTGIMDSDPGVAQMLPTWANASGYSAAPPIGYGAAPVVLGGTSSRAEACADTRRDMNQGHTPATQMPGTPANAAGTMTDVEEAADIIDLPSGFDSFEDLLRHVAENQMEPIKQRMLRIQGAQRPSLMARLDFKALRALAEAPVHIADNAIRVFVTLNYEPSDASTEFLRCLNDLDQQELLG